MCHGKLQPHLLTQMKRGTPSERGPRSGRGASKRWVLGLGRGWRPEPVAVAVAVGVAGSAAACLEGLTTTPCVLADVGALAMGQLPHQEGDGVLAPTRIRLWSERSTTCDSRRVRFRGRYQLKADFSKNASEAKEPGGHSWRPEHAEMESACLTGTHTPRSPSWETRVGSRTQSTSSSSRITNSVSDALSVGAYCEFELYHPTALFQHNPSRS